MKRVGQDVVLVFREGEAAKRASPTFACIAACPVSSDDEQAQVDRGFAAVCCERGRVRGELERVREGDVAEEGEVGEEGIGGDDGVVRRCGRGVDV